MKKLITLTLLSIAMSSCDALWEYRNIHELIDMTWSASDKQVFDFEIQVEGNYEVIIMIRHLHGFAMQAIPVHMNLQKEGVLVDENYEIPIRDEAGDYLGDGGGDLWDVDYTAIESKSLTAGNHQAIISQRSGQDELNLIMEVGLMIQKAE